MEEKKDCGETCGASLIISSLAHKVCEHDDEIEDLCEYLKRYKDRTDILINYVTFMSQDMDQMIRVVGELQIQILDIMRHLGIKKNMSEMDEIDFEKMYDELKKEFGGND